jgi:hypothetical protein
MIRVQIRLTEEQLEKLSRLAERDELSVSDVVGRAVDALIAAMPSPSERALAAAGLYASTKHDIAAAHDHHLMATFRS